MDLNQDSILEGLHKKSSNYSIRLIVHISLNTFLFSLYYHNIPLLVYEDTEASNATNFFVLLNKDKEYRSPIQTYFYHVVPISSLLSLWISDLLGRKQVLQLSIKWNIVFLFFACISLSPYMLIIPNLCMGLNFTNGLVQSYLLVNESVQMKLRNFFTRILFLTWGLSMFVAYFLNYILVDWKVLILLMILGNFYNYWQVKRLVESPVYFRNSGNELKAEENLGRIKENQVENGEWEVVERIRNYDGIKEYFKDLGDKNVVLLVLWFNSALVYNALWTTGITVSDDFYLNGMIIGLALCVPFALSFCLRGVNLWNFGFFSVAIGRVVLFFLSFMDRERLSAEFFYLLGISALVYEVFMIFSLTEITVRSRIQGKMFGLFIFSALASNFLIKQAMLPEPPSNSPCLVISLLSSSSFISLYYLKHLKPESVLVSSPNPFLYFELKPLN